MKYVIDNISWPKMAKYNDSIKNDLEILFRNELTNLNIISKIIVTNNGLEFLPTDKKGDKEFIFTSMVENQTPLDPEGAMAKKLKRNYLKSNRLTKVQWEGIVSLINGTLDKLKLHADIKMVTKDGETIIRTGLTNHTWPSPTKYTKEAV